MKTQVEMVLNEAELRMLQMALDTEIIRREEKKTPDKKIEDFEDLLGKVADALSYLRENKTVVKVHKNSWTGEWY